MRQTPLLLLVAAAAALAVPASAGAITLDEYSVGISADPHSIVRGADGAMWFAETGTGYNEAPHAAIGRIDRNGRVREFRGPLDHEADPQDLVRGRGRTLWFVERGSEQIGRVTGAGAIRLYKIGLRGEQELQGIAPNADGSVTFVADNGRIVGRLTPSGKVRRWARRVPKAAGHKHHAAVVQGPDGRPWVASGRLLGVVEPRTGRIRWRWVGRVSEMVRGTNGTMWLRGDRLMHVDRHGRTLKAFAASRLTDASAMVATPDGHIWLASDADEQIIEVAGARVRQHGPGLRFDEGPHGLDPSSIGVDGDGQLWVTGDHRIARIVKTPSCRVPDVVAQPQQEAVKVIEAAGCRAELTYETSGGDGPVGVTAQSVDRRRALPVGSQVRLTIGRLSNACRWPEDTTVHAIPGGLVGTYEAVVALDRFETRQDVCLPDTGQVQRVSSEVVEFVSEVESAYSYDDALAVAGTFILIAHESGDRYAGDSDIEVLDMRSGKRADVVSAEREAFPGTAIRDDGAVAWIQWGYGSPVPSVFFRELGKPARRITKLDGRSFKDLRLDQTTISWTEGGVPRSVPIN